MVLYVDPHVLEQHTLEPHLKWVVWSAVNLPRLFTHHVVFRLKGFLSRKGVFGGQWDLKSKPFEEREEFQLMKDLYECLPDYRQSFWYQRGLQAISEKGQFSHKDLVAQDPAELDRLFEGYLIKILATMRQEGYRQREGADYPEAMIGRDGTLIKTAHGTHRLAAAKVVGAAGVFPVKVMGVHRQWLAAVLAASSSNEAEAVSAALKEIERRYQAGT
ncbi:hypothetical protein HTT03_09390 [Sulfitobacter sp. S0837]|nr:hypothetical protein [Sulfitobacter maritimus]